MSHELYEEKSISRHLTGSCWRCSEISRKFLGQRWALSIHNHKLRPIPTTQIVSRAECKQSSYLSAGLRGIQEGHAVAVMVSADALAVDGACGHNSPKRGLLTAPALEPVLRNLGYTSPPYMPVKFATLV